MAYRETPAIRRRLEATRASMLDAALSMVAAGGYAGCSMAAVARAAGVGTGTVYRYFPNKSELFAEVFRLACAREMAAAVAAGDECARAGGSHVDTVLATLTTFAGRALQAGRLAYALIIEPVDALVDAERLVFREAYRDLLAVQIRDAIEGGEIPEQDATLTAAALVGAVGEALVLPLARGDTSPHVLSSMTQFTRRCLGGADARHA